MRHGSLFSGIGGFDLAAEWMGWENVFHCEWNEFGKKILNYYWPNAESFDDITKTDFTKYANKIDILTGGFPCQPYSMAGKRKGKEDERHLWPEMLRAIREIKPKYIVGENVFGLLNWNGGLVFDEVHTDLELEGYEVQAVVIPAAAVNAPHGRDRVWFVAYSNGIGNRGESKQPSVTHKQRRGGKTNSGIGSTREQQPLCDITSKRDATNATSFGFCGNSTAEQSQSEALRTWNGMGAENATNSNRNGLNERNGNDEFNTGEGRINAQRNTNTSNVDGDVTDTSVGGIQGHGGRCENGEFQTNEFNTNNSKRQPRMYWEEFPTQSPICSGDDGLPTELDGITFSKWRNESIKGYGNAIVPQVAYEIFKVLQHIDDSLK